MIIINNMTFIILKWGTILILTYLFVRFLGHAETKFELIFTLSKHAVGEKSLDIIAKKDIYSHYYDKILLSESEKNRVITEYSRIEKEIKVKHDCAIGVGYTTCMDINFRAVDMF